MNQHLFTDAEVKAYGRDGFVVVRGLFAAPEMRDITQWVDAIEGAPEAPGKYMKYFEERQHEDKQRLLNRVENFAPFYPKFDALMQSRALKGRCSELFGEEAVLFKDKINFKYPGGGGFDPHQDIQAGWGAYALLFITALVSIDPADERNGCLELAAGQHRRGLIGELWRPLQGDELEGLVFEPCPTEPGDAVFFDSFVPHRSAPNTSAEKRRVLYLTYNRLRDGDHRARYYADKRKSYPPDCEREPGKVYRYKV
jgi:hypothetical protein